MKIADSMLIGGAMAYTFLKSQGLPIGKSLVENDKLDLAREILEEAKARQFRILLPDDHLLAIARSDDTSAPVLADIKDTPADRMGFDVGPKTIAKFRAEIAKAENDRLERPPGNFRKARGTPRALWRSPARWPRLPRLGPAQSSAAEIRWPPSNRPASPIRFPISPRAAGHRFEFLAGEKLPGVEALNEKTDNYMENGMRRPVIAGNWKMYKTQKEAADFVRKFVPLVAASTHCEIILAPPVYRHSRGRE